MTNNIHHPLPSARETKALTVRKKKQYTCQCFQSGRCPDRRACHAEKKEFKVHYTHACEMCYKVRNGLMEHPADECELYIS